MKTIALHRRPRRLRRPGRHGELAHALGVSPGTVTGMLKTLSESNLATYTPYEGAKLTEAGERLAMKVIRRHRLLELFLVQTAQHAVGRGPRGGRAWSTPPRNGSSTGSTPTSDTPRIDPHGDPIPRARRLAAPTGGFPLARAGGSLVPGRARHVDQDPAFFVT
ncbi:MAG: iron dependent repressor, metal binding and dimerization domain protein [Isosphaeraceae bacterium]